MLGKVYFPRLIMPLSIVFSNLIRFAVQFLLFILLMLFFIFFRGADIHITIYVLLFPLLIVLIVLSEGTRAAGESWHVAQRCL